MEIKNYQIFSRVLVVGFVCALLWIMAYLGYQISISKYKVISIGLIALIAGLLFESFRIAEKWTDVFYVFIGSFLVSLAAFVSFKIEEPYNFEDRLAVWPYVFVILYIFIFAIFNSERITMRLGEGITLIQSISIVYWICDYGFLTIDHWLMHCILGICLLFSLFSIANALTYFNLSRTTRLWLSIWSSIIMVLFSIDNIIRICSNNEIEKTVYISIVVYISLQYFLLGVSAMYMMRNFMMLLGFLPRKGNSFNSSYFSELRDLKDEHIERYSEKQIFIGHAIICIVVTSGLYYANYTWHLLPAHTAIWIGFVLFPLLLRLSSGKRKGY